MNNYEKAITETSRSNIVAELRTMKVVETALELTWRGRDGWGDSGIELYHMTEEVHVGEDMSTNHFFEEEVIRHLRYAMPLKRKTLEQLPGAIDLCLSARSGDSKGKYEQMKRVASQLTTLALVRCGFVAETEAGLTITPSTYAAACFVSADITHPHDRAAHMAVGYVDKKDELVIQFEPLPPFDPCDEFGSWWRMLSHNIALNKGV